MGNLENEITAERARARAVRLLDLMDQCRKLDEECLVAPPEEVVPDPEGEDAEPVVPYRYAGVQASGSATWLLFHNDLDALRKGLEHDILEEDPWAPGDVVDLDTGQRWGSFVKVSFVPYTHKVSWKYPVLDELRPTSELCHDRDTAERIGVSLAESGDKTDIKIEELTYGSA